MSRPELINQLKLKNPKIDLSQLQILVNIFLENIESALKNDRNVEIRGFGVFFIRKIREKYSARNPKSGEIIYVPEKKKIRFRPSKKLKEIVNKWNQKFS